jgi:rare lipoprotein A (peptidoglycan hydrolase)
MTHPDPDPLHVEPVVLRCRRCGEPLPFGRLNTCVDCYGRGGNAAGVVVLALVVLVLAIAIAFILAAAPRSAHDSPEAPTSGAPSGAVGVPSRELIGAPHTHSRALAADLVPERQGAAPRIRGTATWYCNDGQRGTSYCTRGYGPDDMVAAIDTDLGFDKGDVVLVRSLAGDEQVTVTIVDVCGCPGSRLIDLTSGAFRRLAPLGLGVLPVTVELAGAERTLPPTDVEYQPREGS